MASQDTTPTVSRRLYSIARALGWTPRQTQALAAVAASVETLRACDPKRLAEELKVSPELSTPLHAACCMLQIRGIGPEVAVELTRCGIDLKALARGPLDELEKNAKSIADLDARYLARWSVAAAALTSEKKPAPGELTPPELPERVEVRRAILGDDQTWEKVAETYYGRTKKSDKVAARLAVANRSNPKEKVVRGTVLHLPAIDGKQPRLPDVAKAAEGLRKFTPHLSEEDSESLASAGVLSPELFIATAHTADLTGFEIPGARLAHLQMQALLAAVEGTPPELAYYLAFQRPRRIEALVSSDPHELVHELSQAKELGVLPDEIEPTIQWVSKWLVSIVEAYPGIVGVFVPLEESSVCERPVPPNTHLENYYAYRLAPGGRTAEALQMELNEKNQWLAEVDDYLAGTASASRNRMLVEAGMHRARLEDADVEAWGGSMDNYTSSSTLSLLSNFIRENAEILELMTALAEGNEAFWHRQYQLALRAYERVEAWFSTRVGSAQDKKWWTNWQSGTNAGKPGFLHTHLSDTSVHYATAPVVEYYEARASQADPNILLAELQTEWLDYGKWRLALASGGGGAPFWKFLYYVKNFMLPMLRGDCYVRLGNYCDALDQYFLVHYLDDYTLPIDPESEDTIIVGSEWDGTVAPRYPSLLNFSIAAPVHHRYHAPYLNDVETKVVQLRVAEALLGWGNDLYRQRKLTDAKARYAQVLRSLFKSWESMRSIDFESVDQYLTDLTNRGENPRAVSLAMSANQQLRKLSANLNFLGYRDDYIPIWTYKFLLVTARYMTERARQLGRDALNFLQTAEQEQGNRRMLAQGVAVSQGQFSVESRRVDEAVAATEVAQAGLDLAQTRITNNENRINEFDALAPIREALGVVGGVMGGASQGAGLGGIGGKPVAAVVGAGLGATFGGVTSYLSGVIELQAQRNELVRQDLELVKAADLAQAGVVEAQIGASVARLTRNVAALNVIFAQSNLAYAAAKSLNAEFWFEHAARLQDLSDEYLENAVGVAFLAEQAFEFIEGRKMDIIRLDYSEREGALAADALLADLDSIEFERIRGRRNKSIPVKKAVSLREKDFLAFNELKLNGSTTFETTIFEFDSDFPGTFHQQIARIEVEVFALTGAQGIRGTLKTGGVSYLRYRATGNATPANTAPDWITYTPNEHRTAAVVQPSETLILSPFDVRKDSVMLRSDPEEELRIFEGRGVGGTWTVSLNQCAGDLDLASIYDVVVNLYFVARHDDALERTVELERRKLLGLGELVQNRSRGWSLKETFPDAMYHLHNPIPGAPGDPWQERTVTFEIDERTFPPNQVNRAVRGVTVVFVGEDGPIEVQPHLAMGSLSLNPADFSAAVSDPAVLSADASGAPPEGTWVLSLKADFNTGGLSLPGRYEVGPDGKVALDDGGQPVLISGTGGVRAFDAAALATIKDVWIILNYDFDRPGECGEPIVFWQHFWDENAPNAIAGGTRAITSWNRIDLSGVSHWNLRNGRMTQDVRGVEGLLVPGIVPDWSQTAFRTRLFLPSSPGGAGGLAVRLRGSPLAEGAEYYLVALRRGSDGRPKLELDVAVASDSSLPIQRANLKTVDLALGAAITRFDLQVRTMGSSIEGLINGRRVLMLRDSSHSSGSFGLYADGEGVGFEEILISSLVGR